MATEEDKTNNGAVGTLVAVLAFAMVGICLAVTALTRDEMTQARAERDVPAAQAYNDLRAEQRQKLSTGKPIEQAMHEVVAKLQREPLSATPPATATAAPAAAPAGSAAPDASAAPAGSGAPAASGAAAPAPSAAAPAPAHSAAPAPSAAPGKQEKKVVPAAPAPVAPRPVPPAPAPAPAGSAHG
jgi:hypothetical protein